MLALLRNGFSEDTRRQSQLFEKELLESELSKSERSIWNDDDETSLVARHFRLDVTFASSFFLRFPGTEVLKSQKCHGGSRLSIWTAKSPFEYSGSENLGPLTRN